MSAEKVIYFVCSDVSDALEAETEDILLIWALTVEGCWHLCAQCSECDAWIQYPIQDHPCTDTESQEAVVEAVQVVAIIPTSITELKAGLLLDKVVPTSEKSN